MIFHSTYPSEVTLRYVCVQPQSHFWNTTFLFLTLFFILLTIQPPTSFSADKDPNLDFLRSHFGCTSALLIDSRNDIFFYRCKTKTGQLAGYKYTSSTQLFEKFDLSNLPELLSKTQPPLQPTTQTQRESSSSSLIWSISAYDIHKYYKAALDCTNLNFTSVDGTRATLKCTKQTSSAVPVEETHEIDLGDHAALISQSLSSTTPYSHEKPSPTELPHDFTAKLTTGLALIFLLIVLLYLFASRQNSYSTARKKLEFRLKESRDEDSSQVEIFVSQNLTSALLVDKSNFVLMFCTCSTSDILTVPFHDVLSVEMVLDNYEVSYSSSSRSITGAIFGGLIAGPVGAIVGGGGGKFTTKRNQYLSSIDIYITVNSLQNPLLQVNLYDASFNAALPFMKAKVSKRSPEYLSAESKARRLVALLNVAKQSDPDKENSSAI